VINPIEPNIRSWILSEPPPEVFKSFEIFLPESYLLYMSIKRTWN